MWHVNATLPATTDLLPGNANIVLGMLGRGLPYRVTPNTMPGQETSPVRGRPQQ